MRFLFFLVIYLCSQSLIAQQLIRFKGSNGKFGFKDNTGKVIVQPKYDDVGYMNMGVALVVNEGKKALIDTSGKEITPFKYDHIFNFKEDLAAVNIGGYYDNDKDDVLGGKWGYINKKGIEITPIKYDYAYDFASGLAKVEINNSILFIDKTGKEVSNPLQIKTEQDNVVYTPTIPLAKPIGKLIKYQDNNKKYGLKDSKGTIIIAPKFDYVNEFENGLARVRIGVNYETWKYGYIDSLGNEVIPIKYHSLSAFEEGLICAGLDHKYGFFDKTGKTIIPFKYKYANSFKDGLAVVVLENNLYGYIDRYDKLIIPAIYNYGYNFKDGMALVSLKDKWGFINKSGKVVIPIIYDNAFEFNEGLAAVNKGGVKSGNTLTGGKYGFINTSGEVVVPLIYDQVLSFYEGLACVTQNNKSGFIDKTGKVIIPLQYEYRTSFDYGKAYVTLNGKDFYIDKTGKETTPSKRITYTNGYYVGEFKDETIRNGKGKMVWESGDIYEGEWLNDEIHGKGKITYANGNIYEGDFVNGKLVNQTNKNTTQVKTNYSPIQLYATIASPEPAESNFNNAIAKTTTSLERGKVLNEFINAVMTLNYTDNEKAGLIADKYASVMKIDFQGVFNSLMKVDSKYVTFLTKNVYAVLPLNQVKALKDMANYVVTKYTNKTNPPAWPSNVPKEGEGWKY